ncbi:MAG TPA: UDP-3-O-(3-hydroxymyristoyl)glucosamine N-acyltransferase [Thermomicrobiales bacterium]|nr:UDP-3-O-(3-hydroxymyristoyl)glucosamine N-acyltransferase [Thermomicrobiales bacterium]
MTDIPATPPPLQMRPVELQDLARRFGLRLQGPNRTIQSFNYVDAPAEAAPGLLTYVTAKPYAERATARGIAGAVTIADFATDGETGWLITDRDPAGAFYTMFAELGAEGQWERLEARVGHGATIAPSAVIHENVEIGEECRIMDHAVLMPNTRLGRNVVIKAGAVIGGDGFEVRMIGGRRRVVPHVGGVWLEDDVEVGSQTCIDRGLFGEFTTIGAGTKIDNLVHIAHRVLIGPDCSVIACAEVSGSVKLGSGVWVGPNASINQQIELGDHAFIGTGSVVTRAVPAHGLAFGNPARLRGWVCRCRTSLEFSGTQAVCRACGTRFTMENSQVARTRE